METLQLTAISFALSQVILSGLLLVGHRSWLIQQKLYALLLLSVACYLLTPVFTGPGSEFVLGSLMVAVPGMFWLFSASLFDDHFQLRRWQIALVATTVVLPFVGRIFHIFDIYLFDFLLFTLPQALEFALLALILNAVARHWASDLIASRRRLRLWFCSLNGAYIFVLLLFRELLFPEAQWLSLLQYVPVGGMLLVTNALLLSYKRDIWSSAVVVPVVANELAAVPETLPLVSDEQGVPVTDVDPEVLGQLDRLMEEERVYREMGLTIGKLANRLDIPEYRLRQMINAGLGYRNFNDFLNSYRIQEASERLADPSQRNLQVLAIALDTGFRSLSSFNKVFKATFDITPTAYRKQQLD